MPLLPSRFHIWDKTCDTYLFGSGLFYLTWWSPAPTIFLNTKWFCSFLWLNNAPLHTHTHIHKHTHTHIFLIHSSTDWSSYINLIISNITTDSPHLNTDVFPF
jgi:hypothetical protein